MYFSFSLSLTEISAIQTRLALRVPSGVRSEDSGRASCPEPKMASLCLIVIIFLTGSRLDLTRLPARIMTVILEVGRREGGSFETKSGAHARPSLGRRHMSTCANLDSNLGGHIAHVG